MGSEMCIRDSSCPYFSSYFKASLIFLLQKSQFRLKVLYMNSLFKSFMQSSGERPADRFLAAAVLILLGVSILMVFSTTAIPSQQLQGSSTVMLRKHLLHILLGMGALLMLYRINPALLRTIALPLLLFSGTLLVLVLIPGIGQLAGGARRWLAIGPLRIQPGEIAKVAMILYFASYIHRQHTRMHSFVPGVVVPLSIMGIFGLLLLREPDFGSTAIICIVVFTQLLTSSRLLHLLGLGVAGAATLALLVFSSPYRLKRLQSFLDPFNDPQNSGYQLIQSLIAVGSGGVTGAGVGAGKQKLFYLPAAHTDFIYAVIAEEFGLVGAIAVMLVFLFIAYRGLLIAWRLSKSPYLCTLALGCTMLIVIPAFLNMGVVLGMLPTKGLVLPLVAYGGTAMVMNLGLVGVLLRLSSLDPETCE